MRIRNFLPLLFALLLFPIPAKAISDQQAVLMGTAPSTRANVITTTNGSAVCLNASATDIVAYLDADAVSGTTPTLDVKIQESPDTVTWQDTLMVFGQVTTSDGTEKLSSDGINYFRCFRARATLSGTLPVYNVLVKLFYRSQK